MDVIAQLHWLADQLGRKTATANVAQLQVIDAAIAEIARLRRQVAEK